MRRLLTLTALVGLVMPVSAIAKPSATHLSFKVRFIQEATYQTKDPDGTRHFKVTLRLFANGPNPFNAPDNYALGTTTFAYTLQGACSSGGGGCKGTTDIATMTHLPGGSLTANGVKVSLSHPPYIIPISKGTGRFAGAGGQLQIALQGKAFSQYNITLP